MQDWIIEADLYRLNKAIEETRDAEQLRVLQLIAERKQNVLNIMKSNQRLSHR